MIFVQKLPALDPEMRDALRTHIIRKRQRLKQELEQDAIEKRLKRERELKQLQDAMTLDQIKEQLSVLETKLETLKDEKHNLFIQLKQVLNEDSNRRKQNESDHKKKSEETQNLVSDDSNSSSINSTSAANSLRQSDISSLNNNLPKVDLNSAPQRRPTARHTPPRIQPCNTTRPNLLTYAVNSGPYFGSPLSQIPLIYPAQQSNLPRQNFGMKPMHPELHVASSKTPLLSGPMQELIPPTPLNFGNQQRIQVQNLNSRPFLMDIPMSLEANHQSGMKAIVGGKRSLSVADFSDSIDERSPVRKVSNNFMYPNSNQFMLDNVPSHGIPNLSHYNLLNPTPSSLPIGSIGVSVPSPSTNLIQQTIPRKQLSHQLSNFDYMISPSKPGVMTPGLNSFYPTHPSLIPQTSPYPGIDGDLKHFAPPYYSLAQQYSTTSRHNNLPLLQAEHNSQYLTAANLTYNTSRKPPHKNHFSPNK